MADIAVTKDLVRIDVAGNVDHAEQRGRGLVRNAKRSLNVAIDTVLARINARLTNAAETKPANRRIIKRLVYVAAFLLVAFVFSQAGILHALLAIPFAIFG